MRTAKEKRESYNQLTLINGISWHNSMNYPTHSALINYEAVATSILNRKSIPQVFTYSPHGVAFTPEINLSKFGASLYPLILDYPSNPYFAMQQQFNISLHPRIERFADCLSRAISGYQLSNLYDYKRVAAAMEFCMTSFKVHSQLRNNQALDRSWEQKYRSLQEKYKQFFLSIMSETEKFEIHALHIEVKQISEALYEQIYGFDEKDCPTLIDEICKSIITPIWRSKKQLNLLGILSKWVIQANGTLAKKLFFFTKVGSQTTEGNHNQHICQALSPFIRDTLTDRVMVDRHELFNANNMIRFQGPPSNSYDYNQIDINERLDLVDAYFVGTDYWLRINGNKPTLTIEKSLY